MFIERSLEKSKYMQQPFLYRHQVERIIGNLLSPHLSGVSMLCTNSRTPSRDLLNTKLLKMVV